MGLNATMPTSHMQADDELTADLVQRIVELEFEVKRAKMSSPQRLIVSAWAGFIFSALSVLLSLALAVLPYVNETRLEVPRLISYIAGFAVLLFAYFTYKSFQWLTKEQENARAFKYAIQYGDLALEDAGKALREAKEESA